MGGPGGVGGGGGGGSGGITVSFGPLGVYLNPE